MSVGHLNLKLQRGPSVWNRGSRETHATRWITGLLGAALACEGSRSRSAIGWTAAIGGTALATRAVLGHDDLWTAWQWLQSRRHASRTDDAVTESSYESFPASDAPAWNP